MKQIIADILGYVITAGCLISPQFKKRGQILFMNLLVNALAAVQYLLLGQVTAVAVSAVAIVQILHSSFRPKDKRPSRAFLILYSVAYIVAGLLPFAVGGQELKPIALLPTLGALFFMGSVAQENVQRMRLFSLANATVNLIYTAAIRSTMFFAQLVTVISVVTALIRYHKKSKSEQTETPTAQ